LRKYTNFIYIRTKAVYLGVFQNVALPARRVGRQKYEDVENIFRSILCYFLSCIIKSRKARRDEMLVEFLYIELLDIFHSTSKKEIAVFPMQR
jgi:hypothetical protein